MEQKTKEILPGIRLVAVKTNKFKTCLVGVHFLTPLSRDKAAQNALIPYLLRRGTKKHPDMVSMAAALDELYGASIDPVVRKKGETQCLGFVGSFLDDAFVPEETSVLEAGIRLLGEILFDPAGDEGSFRGDYLESERQNLLDRIHARINDKQQYALYRLTSQMCAGEPYGVDKWGEEEEAAAITGESLWAQYQSLLREAPLHLYYCGSKSFEEVEALMKTVFAPLSTPKRQTLRKPEASGLERGEIPRSFGDHLDVTQGKLTMGFRLPGPMLSAKALSALMVTNAIFGGSTMSKLFMNVRERLSLCYYASAMTDQYKGLLLVSSGVAFENFEKAKDEILAQLDDVRKGVVTEEELQSARRYIANNLKTTLDSQGRLEDFWLGQAISLEGLSPETLYRTVEGVTLETVQETAKTLWLDSVYFLQGGEEEA